MLQISIITALLSAVSNAIYGATWETVTRKALFSEKATRATSMGLAFWLYFLAGGGILISSLFVSNPTLSEWHGMDFGKMVFPHSMLPKVLLSVGVLFGIMSMKYSVHTWTEVTGKQHLNQSSYTTTFIAFMMPSIIGAKVLFGEAHLSIPIIACLIVILACGIWVSTATEKLELNKYTLIIIVSAITRGIAFAIDDTLSKSLFSFMIYEGLTFFVPSILSFIKGSIEFGRREFTRECIYLLKSIGWGFFFPGIFSAFEYLLGVYSTAIMDIDTVPSAIQGSVPVVNVVVYSLYKRRLPQKKEVIAALITTAAIMVLTVL
jgi:hypothetical protein